MKETNMILRTGDIVTLKYDGDNKLGRVQKNFTEFDTVRLDSKFDLIQVKWFFKTSSKIPPFYHSYSLEFMCRPSKKCKRCYRRLQCITEGE